jgi:hypothetical protein
MCCNLMLYTREGSPTTSGGLVAYRRKSAASPVTCEIASMVVTAPWMDDIELEDNVDLYPQQGHQSNFEGHFERIRDMHLFTVGPSYMHAAGSYHLTCSTNPLQ